MQDFCREFAFCSVVPPEWHWLMAIVMPLLFLVLLGIPIANILHRAGRSRWWTILAFVPLLNLVFLWIFAFARWPVVDSK